MTGTVRGARGREDRGNYDGHCERSKREGKRKEPMTGTVRGARGRGRQRKL